MPRRKGLGLWAVAALVTAAAPAAAHDHGGWSPGNGGPRLGFSAADVLAQPPPRHELPLDLYAAWADIGGSRVPTLQRHIARDRRGGDALAHRPGAARAAAFDARGRTFSTGRTAAEPTMGVARDGTLFFVGLVAEPFRAASILQRSRDGGLTWEVIDTLAPGSHDENTTMDPFVYLDPATDRVFHNDYLPPCSPVSISDDKGESFSSSANCLHADHQSIFAGPAPADRPAPVGYPNAVYYCAISGGFAATAAYTGCSSSLDGGVTWRPTATPPFVEPGPSTGGQMGVAGWCTAAAGHGVVGPDGTIYLPRGWCGQPYLAISRDGGDTWERVQVADNGMAVGYALSSDSILEEHEASVAVDPAGNVYFGWTAEDHLPYLAVSRDGGRTFGRPIMIAPPGVVEAWTPFLEAGETGRLAIVYVGSADSPGGPYCVRTTRDGCVTADGGRPRPRADYDRTTWNGYISVTVDALSAQPTFVTAPVNEPGDPLVRGVCVPHGCGPMREFIDVDIGPEGTPWASMVDACTADPAETPDQCLPALMAIGIVGRLDGAPPLLGPLPAPPDTPATPDAPPGGAPPAGSHPAAPRRCAGTVRVALPRRLARARVRVAGRNARVVRRRGRLYASIDRRRLPQARVRVRIDGRDRHGRRVRLVRHVRGCPHR